MRVGHWCDFGKQVGRAIAPNRAEFEGRQKEKVRPEETGDVYIGGLSLSDDKVQYWEGTVTKLFKNLKQWNDQLPTQGWMKKSTMRTANRPSKLETAQ